jgi:phosphocarrier protein HPr
MNGELLQRTVTVTNSQGLHMRPITSFVELACKYQSNIFVSRDGQPKINGKSPLGLLGLAAEQGTELILEASGPDAQEALDKLVGFINELPTIEP